MAVNEDYLRLLLNEAIAEFTAEKETAQRYTVPGYSDHLRNEARGKRAAYEHSIKLLDEIKRKLDLP